MYTLMIKDSANGFLATMASGYSEADFIKNVHQYVDDNVQDILPNINNNPAGAIIINRFTKAHDIQEVKEAFDYYIMYELPIEKGIAFPANFMGESDTTIMIMQLRN